MTGEAHEKHECNVNETLSAYGMDSDIFSSGKFNSKAFEDWLIGDWVEYEVEE